MPKRGTNKTVKLVVPDANEAQIKMQEPRSSLHTPSNSNIHWSNKLAPLVEIEELVMEWRLFRSYFNKEQLQKPLLQVFEENSLKPLNCSK